MPSGDYFGAVKAGQEGVGFLVNQTSRAFNARLTTSIARFGLDTDQYTVVRHVVREIEVYPEGVPVTALSSKLNVGAPTLEAAALKLERGGWLECRRDGDDLLLTPTRRAIRQVTSLADASHWMLQAALNGFSNAEIEELTAYLKRIIRNLDAPLGDDEGPLGER